MRSFEDTLRRVEALEGGLADRVSKTRTVREAAERVTSTASTAGGAFTVTVDHTGTVLDVAGTEAIHKLPTEQVGPAVLAAIQQAQGRLAELLRTELGPIGDDPVVATVIEQYEQRFPVPATPTELPPEPRMDIGDIDD